MGVMCQNPNNAILCAGHGKGIVSMWSPNMREPVAKMLAHRQAVRGVAVDRTGTYLATAGTDRSLKIWDIRQFKCLQNYRISAGASQLEFSGRGMLGVAMGNTVEVFKDCCTNTIQYPYMRHRAFKRITDIHFAPYEDAMGIGHEAGFTSILVPGKKMKLLWTHLTRATINSFGFDFREWWSKFRCSGGESLSNETSTKRSRSQGSFGEDPFGVDQLGSDSIGRCRCENIRGEDGREE